MIYRWKTPATPVQSCGQIRTSLPPCNTYNKGFYMNEVCQREFAHRENCLPKLVRNRLERGYSKANPDGTIDSALAGTGWRKANAERIAKAQQNSSNWSRTRPRPSSYQPMM